jgi:hypothetical protein
VHTHPVGVGVAAFLVGGAIGATVGGTLVGRMAKEEIRKARGPIKVPPSANVPKSQQYTPNWPKTQPSFAKKPVSHLYTF